MVRAVDHEDHTEPGGSDLFDGYLEPDRPHAGAFDEMFHRDGRVRSAYRALHSAIAPTAPTDLAVRADALDRAYLDRGITFSLSGQERPIPLDIVPRVIAAAEWSKLQRGIVQRVRALEAFLADIYGDAEIVRDGVLPRRPITSTWGTNPRPPACTPRPPSPGTPAPGCARTSRTSRCCWCARWGSRPATCRATCCPGRTPRSGRRS